MSEEHHIHFTSADIEKLVNQRVARAIAKASRESARRRRLRLRRGGVVVHSGHRTYAEQIAAWQRYTRATGWKGRTIHAPQRSTHRGDLIRKLGEGRTLRILKEVNEYAD